MTYFAISQFVVSDSEFELLRELARAQAKEPLALAALAKELGISSSQLVRSLRPLVEKGWVERRQVSTPVGRIVHYLPRAIVHVQWISPATGAAEQWTLQDEADWSLPLLGQIPDAAARAALTHFVAGLRSGRRLRPRKDAPSSDSFDEPSTTLIVYGSTARGDARPDSDVDVIAIVEDDSDEDEILDAAAATSIVSVRPLQVKVIPRDRLGRLPQGIAQAIDEHGVIVFDGLRVAAIWERVYGRRRGRASPPRRKGMA